MDEHQILKQMQLFDEFYDAEIKAFCTSTYNVTFDMLAKVSVTGDDICPLYAYLTSDAVPIKDRGEVKWNFEKFLLDKTGTVVARYRSKVAPDAIVPDLEKALIR